MIERRELLKRSALLALSAGIPALAGIEGCSSSNPKPVESSAPPAPPPAPVAADKPSPLTAPPEGKLPVAFVLGKYAEVLDFCGPLEVFAGATTKEGKELFAPFFVAATLDPVTVGGGMKVVPDHSYKTAPAPKLIVIPAMDTTDLPQGLYDWIRTASKTTDLTMSVCNGAFVLARTGLLSSRSATCHHGGFYRFAGTYPDVHLKRGARFVEDGNLVSAGGISSGIDLALRIVERYVGHDQTLQLADAMEYQGLGWLNPNSNAAYAKMPAFTEEHPLCPVCLQDADRQFNTSYKGKTYYFCAKGEKEYFEKHTEIFDRFLAEDAALVTRAAQ